MNPKNPTRREKQEHEDIQDMLFTGVGVLLVSKAGCWWKLLEEEERERTAPIVAFDHGFLTQENADTLPNLICRDSRNGQTGVTCSERKRLHSILNFISGRFHQRSWFSQDHFEM